MKRKKTVLSLLTAICLFVGANILPVYAAQDVVSTQVSQNNPIPAPNDMEIASGSHSGTQFVDTYSLTKSNGAKVNFWISNKGSVSVRITINGKEGKTIAPGKSGFISASIGTFSKDYKFEAVPTPVGGSIDIDYRIAQRN